MYICGCFERLQASGSYSQACIRIRELLRSETWAPLTNNPAPFCYDCSGGVLSPILFGVLATHGGYWHAAALQYKPESQADSQSLQRVHYTQELLRVRAGAPGLCLLASERSLGAC
jgi:hypothetical protein|uniref:Uncharacterized protein n=1 Tax=Mus musculus TaxID=10090 RepID=Q8C5I8_MOUSE|nr:unnamed protein product [Mus musculus]